jgi:hypothetical protein
MKNPKSAAWRRRRARFLPTPRDRLILEAVRTHTRLTREHIRRLFFRKRPGGMASVQAVNARLQKLAASGYLEPVVVNAGHGAGPYAYALGPAGKALLLRLAAGQRRGHLGPVWHHLEIADFRVRLEESLRRQRGELVEWLGEAQVRALLLGRRGWPVPDALVHWRLQDKEGTFFLEWDRGSESLAVLTAKLVRYGHYWRARGHRELLPGLGLRPRLVLVLKSGDRSQRLARWLASRRQNHLGATVLLGVAEQVLREPLGEVWWRSDTAKAGPLAAP